MIFSLLVVIIGRLKNAYKVYFLWEKNIFNCYNNYNTLIKKNKVFCTTFLLI